MNSLHDHAHLLTHRRFLGTTALTLGLPALHSLFAAESPVPALPGLPHFAPKAKRVIYMMQTGGPSHVDLFDDKPELRKQRGQNIPEMEKEFFRTMKLLKPAGEQVADRYHELRIYTVRSNKMDGVLERFRDTVEPLRRKHGIVTIGYWTENGTTNGGTFAYLMAAANKEELQQQEKAFGADADFKKGYAASNQKHGKTVDKIMSLPLVADTAARFDFAPGTKPRVFDLRIYSVLPGKLNAFRNRWRDFAVPIYARHGLHSLGWWVSDKKDANGHDQFICLLAGESVETIQKSIGAFHQDADWLRVEKETEKDGKLRGKVEAFKMKAADFSKLK